MNCYTGSMTEDEWRQKLTPEQYRALRQKGTEAPWSGELLDEERQGMFVCAACGQQLFASDTKFDAHCGWPSFYDALPGSVKLNRDDSFGMERTVVTCANCGSHLGHVFSGEGFATPTDQRFCVNSVGLKFIPANS